MKIECSAMNGECHGIYRDVWMAWADNQAMWGLSWLQEALGRGAACSVGDAQGSRSSIAHQLRPRALFHSWTKETGEQHCSHRARILVLCAILHHLVQTSLELLLLCLAEDDDKDPGLAFCQVRGREEGEDSSTVIWKNWFISGSTSCYAKHFVNHLFSSLHFH